MSDQEKSPLAMKLEKIRLNQDFTHQVATKKEITEIPMNKPGKHWWFTVSDKEEHQILVALIEYGDNKDPYVVGPEMQSALDGEWAPKNLYLCQTKQGDLFWWPIRVPNELGFLDKWSASAHQIVSETAGKWIRVVSNRQMGRYDVLVSEQGSTPEWPDEPIENLMEKTFHEKIIDSPDHIIVKKLRGIE